MDSRKEKKKELTVAIVLKDIKKAQEISIILREYSIFGHFYQSLDQFWVDIKSEVPDLAIVDLQMMSHGEVRLKNHPLVIEEKVPLAFYYNESSAVLLNSTYGLFNFGHIKEEFNLRGQIEQILKRREEFVRLREDKEILEERVSRLRRRNAKVISEIFDIKNVTSQQQLALKIGQEVDKNLQKFNFLESLGIVFQAWQDVNKFSIYELNIRKERLISQPLLKSKYITLPSLYLGKKIEQGIEGFVSDMATQVSRDIMGKGIKTIKIKGEGQKVKMLLMLEVNEDRFEGFSWSLFEMILSGIYSRTMIGVQENIELKDEINSWDFFSTLDQMSKDGSQEQFRLAHISFDSLNNIVKTRPKNRFFWRAFYKEFTFELNKIVAGNGFFSFFGTRSLMLAIPQENAQESYGEIRRMIAAFPFYRFFEDGALVVSKEVAPSIRTVTASSANMLRHIDKEYDELESAIEVSSQRAARIMSQTEV